MQLTLFLNIKFIVYDMVHAASALIMQGLYNLQSKWLSANATNRNFLIYAL